MVGTTNDPAASCRTPGEGVTTTVLATLGFQRDHGTTDAAGEVVWLLATR
ncbi:hypothetical protein JD78_00368 [Modestobacter roseus]|uniref:Uncharacterized protein n=1 Tax=Modestobacter roseus TaxID=1181884 RepID=A0A562ILU5_9ACTN|nr:hypothetical protein JD78_00368 [Modestobacter roseus]